MINHVVSDGIFIHINMFSTHSGMDIEDYNVKYCTVLLPLCSGGPAVHNRYYLS
jgi:hypothetical protein